MKHANAGNMAPWESGDELMPDDPTPIETLLSRLPAQDIVEEVLIPEQCAIVWINDVRYHVTIEVVQ